MARDDEKVVGRFIKEGMRLDMQAADRKRKEDQEQEGLEKIYSCQVYEIVSEDTLEITMPVEQGKLILLPIGKEYDIRFYAGAVLYQCFAKVIDRYKSNGTYLLLMELTSNLRKHQRREFYRFSCVLEMLSRNVEEEEMMDENEKENIVLQPGLPLKRSVIVDISGGGLRFISTQRYEVGSLLVCIYNLLVGGERKQLEVIGKVLSVREMDNRRGHYEHRVQYHNLDSKVREQIIKYIFEEERKSRNK